MKRIILYIICISFNLLTNAQGQSPNNIKWMEINSVHAKIVFPAEIEQYAQKSANLIDYMYDYQTKSINSFPKKIPVILYNQSTYSNGFARLMPRMSGWYMTPMQNTSEFGNTDWIYELSAHEFRHVFQYEKYNSGFTKISSILFGQLGTLTGQYSVPYWYSEGDAICTETAFTGLGRGRIPQFNMHIRTMLLNDYIPGYDIAKFRSYKSFYPSHYHLGWLLTSFGRIKYGYDLWDKTIKSAMNYSFWPYAFSRSLKKHTGNNEKQFYKQAMKDFKKKWENDLNNRLITEANIITKDSKKDWTKYSEQNFYSNNKILAIKTSMKGDISTFYIIDYDGNETKITTTDAEIISYAKNKIVWARRYPDPRWELKDFSDIIIYDLEKKKESRLTYHQKLFAPAISPDGKKIAAIEYGSNLNSAIVIIDEKTGKTLKKISNKNNLFLRTPAWDNKGEKIVITATGETGTYLKIIDAVTDSILFSENFEYENIERPVFFKNFILYNSNYDGIDNIYALDLLNGVKYRITSRKYGALNPRLKGDKMIFLDYNLNGYRIAEMNLNTEDWTPLNKIEKYKYKTAELISRQEQNKIILDPNLIPETTFKAKKYRNFKNILNIHSWGFYTSEPNSYNLDDIKNYKPEIGFNIYSDDIMNRLSARILLKYQVNERNFGSDLNLSYNKFFTKFSFGGGWSQRTINYGSLFGYDNWEEWYTTMGIGLPVYLTEGIFYKKIQLNASFSLLKKYHKREDIRYLYESGNGMFSYMTFSGIYYNLRRRSNQDINSKFGQYISLTFKTTPQTYNMQGSQFSATGILYLPGLFNHHSVVMKGGFEIQKEFVFEQIPEYYWFSTSQSVPRGYGLLSIFDKYYTGQINYTLPVIYPDINIGPLVHFKRIRANIFTDYAVSSYSLPYTKIKYLSSGFELFIQMYLLRLGEPIEIGGRISYLHLGNNEGKKFVTEVLILGIPF